MRLRVAVLLVLIASAANAAQIVVKYKPPYYLDDQIPFSILMPFGASVRQSEAPKNLIIETGPTVPVGTMLQAWFTSRPDGGGPARIPPFAITTATGIEIAPAVSLDILPVNQSDNPDTTALLQKMRDSGRPPVVSRVVVRPQPAYAGQIVQIAWEVLADGDARMFMRDKPKIEGAIPAAPDLFTGMDAAGGKLVRRTEVQRIVFVPEEAGAVIVPAEKIEGQYTASGIPEPVWRMTPRQIIAILPVPGGLAPGTYVMNAAKPRVGGGTVTMSVDITGPGDPGTAHPPDLGKTDVTYLLRPGPLTLAPGVRTQPSATRTWTIEFHAGDHPVDIPPISFASWDPATQQTVTAHATVDATVPAKSDVAKENRPKDVNPRAVPMAMTIFGIVDLLLLIALLVANAICSI